MGHRSGGSQDVEGPPKAGVTNAKPMLSIPRRAESRNPVLKECQTTRKMPVCEETMHRVRPESLTFCTAIALAILSWTSSRDVQAQAPGTPSVEGQPLAANVERLLRAL